MPSLLRPAANPEHVMQLCAACMPRAACPLAVAACGCALCPPCLGWFPVLCSTAKPAPLAALLVCTRPPPESVLWHMHRPCAPLAQQEGARRVLWLQRLYVCGVCPAWSRLGAWQLHGVYTVVPLWAMALARVCALLVTKHTAWRPGVLQLKPLYLCAQK